jgi:ornithine cyclodeaminase/alanine dehydrogenase-like protein (mu-crystallin family)
MEELIVVMENAHEEFSAGRSIQPPRSGFELSKYPGLMETLSAYLQESDQLGVKILNSRRANPSQGRPFIYATVLLFAVETGELEAILDGGSITAARTAAASAVATKYLSRQDSQNLAIVGTGRQGRTHLQALTCVRSIRRIALYDTDRDRAEGFQREMSAHFPQPMAIASSVEQAVESADIIALCTSSDRPVLLGKWVKAGTHINSIASYSPKVREVDSELFAAARVVADSKTEALEHAGDVLIPLEEGRVGRDCIYGELGEVVGGRIPGRENDAQVTLYKSMGLAIQDVAAANYLYEKALEQGIGTEIAF